VRTAETSPVSAAEAKALFSDLAHLPTLVLAVSGGPSTLAALVQEAQRAEAAGFASIWLSNIFSFDALTVLALAGKETHLVELGTFVVPTYPRHPAALAQQALTVQAATNGRLALGIGLSHQVVIENMFGLDYSKPIPHTKEYLTILNGLLAQEPVKFTGELYRVAARLTVPGATKPTVLVAALGPAMLRLPRPLGGGGCGRRGQRAAPADPGTLSNAGRAARDPDALVEGVRQRLDSHHADQLLDGVGRALKGGALIVGELELDDLLGALCSQLHRDADEETLDPVLALEPDGAGQNLLAVEHNGIDHLRDRR